ncbi:tRNA (adenosine(37)-N6)-dimethylallyltransferase MiaA [Mycoavidus sp. B2-EB]|uniref:tRNA (adenosine(37)-N6)-dimethylallyltransferase MiaA n=1 Tax=Mycoavidus sp. B2-EB TaxID=2651972 RepID=UPI001626D589|nr:tRNA (adenosine(37)-N6)-dimethylallyltransferase MiaA [Mycoavidus sp. B2-EB]BBO60409.1 tRNA dimethylallyltransferase [Mycoavidus sp. B2-EB]
MNLATQHHAPDQPPYPPVICLLGPTASGKTAAALALAKHVPLEIISLDSALVYREMDIGTAKPTSAERALVTHHLIDILDPSQTYSAAAFKADAQRLIGEIYARKALPLLVGGTMLYYKALTTGLAILPSADPQVRATLDREAARDGWPALHARLAACDPELAARLAPNDAQRIQRALEVWLLTRQPMSQLLAVKDHANAPYDYLPIALEPSDRGVLHKRIETRFDTMLEAGFVAEVTRLRARGDLHADLPAMRCVGYRQIWAYLDGKINQATMREQGIVATRQLCKRQLTWLRAIDKRLMIDCCAPDVSTQVIKTAMRIWSTHPLTD